LITAVQDGHFQHSVHAFNILIIKSFVPKSKQHEGEKANNLQTRPKLNPRKACILYVPFFICHTGTLRMVVIITHDLIQQV